MNSNFYSEDHFSLLKKSASVVRALTLDAIENANSGHPGLPLGCADLGTLIYSELMQHNPKNPGWVNRDRFVLSGGHGSMLIYSLLHLTGYDLSMDDLRSFRSLGSKTPGHPEYGDTPGVETTTGPLGQGFAAAVGMAIAQKNQAARYNEDGKVLDNCTIVLAGDGDMMEGVVLEAVSLAGTQELDNLIVFYDSNNKTIDGDISLTFTENVGDRFSACGWNVTECDGYDYDGITSAFKSAKHNGNAPTLIIVNTLIGKDAPHFEDNAKAHSGAMGKDEIALLKERAGLPVDIDFHVPGDIYDFFSEKRKEWDACQKSWSSANESVEKSILNTGFYLENAAEKINTGSISVGEQIESRTTFSMFLDAVQKDNPTLIGGTADLTDPCLKGLKPATPFSPEDRSGNFIYYGVREHAMAAISNGIALYDGYRSYCATFLSFVDYLRPSLRLSALRKLPIIYVLAYDSIYNGEDGPTHQPVEQLASLRCMPNLTVIRPADPQEGIVCAKMALNANSNPVACITTRQKLNCFAKENSDWEASMESFGAYIVKQSVGVPVYSIVATGSEVNSVLEAVQRMDNSDHIRIISMPCREYFLRAKSEKRAEILDPDSTVIVVEAAVEQGWSVLSEKKVHFIGVSEFGASAPGPIIAGARKIDSEGVFQRLTEIIK